MNDKLLFPPEEIREMAIKIARSKGRTEQDKWLEKTLNFFKKRVRDLKS